MRTDRGPESLGTFADLVAIPSALRLFAEGRYGTTGFLLVGMAQLRHAAGGLWQEWYAKLDGGQWAWLTEAQGRLYLTFERPELHAPPLDELAPGRQLQLAGETYTVAERGTASYVSALGEIPYRLVPNAQFQFADLADARGGFATIDYGDSGDVDDATVYIGAQVAPEALGLSGGEPVANAPQGQCPECNGSLELRAPDQTLRVACPYCGTLVSVERGALSILARQATVPKLAIPLGRTIALPDAPRARPTAFTLIGFIARSAYLDEIWWPFEEYLLHAPELGFRWLVRSDGHWSYVQPVAAGAVQRGDRATYQGIAFEPFSSADLRVDAVLGECYWRVEVGERVRGDDFIAPPAMLSCETTRTERTWSLSSYLPVEAVYEAAGKDLRLGSPVGVAPNQPYGTGLSKVCALLAAAFLAVAFGVASSTNETQVMAEMIWVLPPSEVRPAASPAQQGEPGTNITFSTPFPIDAGSNVVIDVAARLTNNWAYAVIDLVNEDTGDILTFDSSLEYYAGVEGGESWSEGSWTDRHVVAPLRGGIYVLRVDAQQGGNAAVQLDVRVRQGVFRWPWFLAFGGALVLVMFGAALRASSVRRRRWENAQRRYQPAPPSKEADHDE